MAISLDYPPGATPLDPDETAGLIPSHIATHGQLNEWELAKDAQSQLEHKSYRVDEIPARFSHRLVSIHPFANGNGRLSRTMADLLLVQQGAERFSWGAGTDLVAGGDARQTYLGALRAADAKDYGPLLAFVRS